MAGKKWLDAELEFIRENYKHMSCGEMAECLGRSERSVEHVSARLHLIREPQVGDVFHRLTIKSKRLDEKTRKTLAVCECECGIIKEIRLTSIVQGHIVSCGCWKEEKASERMTSYNFKHGASDTLLYGVWASMKDRCNNTNNRFYERYGGRGIKVCQEWTDDFLSFLEWSANNGYRAGLTIDRINNDGNYEPENCRWVTRGENARNRGNNRLDNVLITAFGEKHTLSQWLADARCKAKSGATICYRIGAGWTPEDAISKPSERSK